MYSGVFSGKGHMVVGQGALEVGGGDHELGFRFLDVNMKYFLYNLMEKSEQWHKSKKYVCIGDMMNGVALRERKVIREDPNEYCETPS